MSAAVSSDRTDTTTSDDNFFAEMKSEYEFFVCIWYSNQPENFSSNVFELQLHWQQHFGPESPIFEIVSTTSYIIDFGNARVF